MNELLEKYGFLSDADIRELVLEVLEKLELTFQVYNCDFKEEVNTTIAICDSILKSMDAQYNNDQYVSFLLRAQMVLTLCIGDTARTIVISRKIVDLFRHSDDSMIKIIAGEAALCGGQLISFQSPVEAIVLYNEFLSIADMNQEILRSALTAKIMFEKARLLFSIGNIKESLHIYKGIVTEFEESRDNEIRMLVSAANRMTYQIVFNDVDGITFSDMERIRSMDPFQKAEEYELAGYVTAAVQIYEDIIVRKTNFTDALSIAKALLKRGELEAKYGGTTGKNAAIDTASSIINEYIDNFEPNVEVVVAQALLNKAQYESEVGGEKEAGYYDS